MVDLARANLVSTYVNASMNAGFGMDKVRLFGMNGVITWNSPRLLWNE